MRQKCASEFSQCDSRATLALAVSAEYIFYSFRPTGKHTYTYIRALVTRGRSSLPPFALTRAPKAKIDNEIKIGESVVHDFSATGGSFFAVKQKKNQLLWKNKKNIYKVCLVLFRAYVDKFDTSRERITHTYIHSEQPR